MNVRHITRIIRAVRYARYIIPIILLAVGVGLTGNPPHGGDPIDDDPVVT